jgi:hypothetical protein
MAPLFSRIFSFYLLVFFFIYCVHAFELGQEARPPCLLGVFSFICWLFFFLFSYIVYMLTKTIVTCLPKSMLKNG